MYIYIIYIYIYIYHDSLAKLDVPKSDSLAR